MSSGSESGMPGMREVPVSHLGRCPNTTCNALLTIYDQPTDEWGCPECFGPLTPTAFGYSLDGELLTKVRWIDEIGDWSGNKPEIDFVLNGWRVFYRYPVSLRLVVPSTVPAEPAYAAA